MAFPSCVISDHGPTMTRRDENPCPDGRKNYFPSDMGESFTIVGKVGWKSFESLAVEPTFDIFFMTTIKLYEVLSFFFEIGQEWVISLWTSETPLVRWFFLLWWEHCWFNQKFNTNVLAIVEVVFRQKKLGWFPNSLTSPVPLFETPLWFSVFSQTLTTVPRFPPHSSLATEQAGLHLASRQASRGSGDPCDEKQWSNNLDTLLGGGCKYFLFSTLFGEDSHFD